MSHKLLLTKKLVKASGFYDIFEPYDEVMADKGFSIAMELNERRMHAPYYYYKGRRGIDQFFYRISVRLRMWLTRAFTQNER